MPIVAYSKLKEGNKPLSANFSVKEFACKDGNDNIWIDSELVMLIQKIRDYFNKPIGPFNSAYRTPEHNAKEGGAKDSYHIKGQAIDFVIPGISLDAIAKCAETMGARGIELNRDKGYVHIDTRPTKYFWIQQGGKANTVSTFGGTAQKPTETPGVWKIGSTDKSAVINVQNALNKYGCKITVDGVFGRKTLEAVRFFQAGNNLAVDGIVGTKTWAKLQEGLKG